MKKLRGYPRTIKQYGNLKLKLYYFTLSDYYEYGTKPLTASRTTSPQRMVNQLGFRKDLTVSRIFTERSVGLYVANFSPLFCHFRHFELNFFSLKSVITLDNYHLNILKIACPNLCIQAFNVRITTNEMSLKYVEGEGPLHANAVFMSCIQLVYVYRHAPILPTHYAVLNISVASNKRNRFILRNQPPTKIKQLYFFNAHYFFIHHIKLTTTEV